MSPIWHVSRRSLLATESIERRVSTDVTLMDHDHDHHVGVGLTAIALEAEAAVGAGHVVEKLLVVLADERLLVVTRDVVPGDAVIIHVVQDGHAGFGGAVDVELGIVRLFGLLVAGLRPRIERPAYRCLVSG